MLYISRVAAYTMCIIHIHSRHDIATYTNTKQISFQHFERKRDPIQQNHTHKSTISNESCTYI
jgi:hypothetical protein